MILVDRVLVSSVLRSEGECLAGSVTNFVMIDIELVQSIMASLEMAGSSVHVDV
jgi:hypothetical protein